MAEPVHPQELAAPTDMDGIGRFIAQALADTGLNVSTYGVLANLIHVETPDGCRYLIELDADDEEASE